MPANNRHWIGFIGFENDICETWQALQNESDFCDMTLACEDKQFLSYKIIISSSSPILMNI